MQKTYIIRTSEIVLKGKNRNYFEKKLKNNLVLSLKSNKITDYEIKKLPGRFFIKTSNNCDFLKYIFGVHSIAESLCVEITTNSIKDAINNLIKNKQFETFRVSTKRSDKTVKIDSYELNCEIGDYIISKYNKKVDLKNFDINIGIEIFDNMAFVFIESKNAVSGLPIGTNGNILVYVDNNKKNNYELSSFMLMNRGCKIYFCINDGLKLTFLKKFEQGKKFQTININKINEEYLAKYKINTIVIGFNSLDYINLINKKNHQIFKNNYLKDLIILSPLHSYTNLEIKQKINDLIVF
jgi:adenylyl- and sulfurtransferase ThiI